MSKVKREVDCLQRLQDLTGQIEDILVFLKIEGLIDDNVIRTIRQSSEPCKDIQLVLRNLQVTQKLQLLEYVWSILPVENIAIMIVTDRNSKDFIYNG